MQANCLQILFRYINSYREGGTSVFFQISCQKQLLKSVFKIAEHGVCKMYGLWEKLIQL